MEDLGLLVVVGEVVVREEGGDLSYIVFHLWKINWIQKELEIK